VDVFSAMADPNHPGAQGEHTGAPDRLYCPAGHGIAVPFRDPAKQVYPATHAPSQEALVSPGRDP
jgi:hypothetical protein